MPRTRKKKNENKDFQKVKLKVGKKLPKAKNETTASFKTKSIQLTDQLKDKGDTSQPKTKRKLGINDVLANLQHYNSSVVYDGLVGLKELCEANSDIIPSNLSVIIDRVCPLFVSKEANVHQAVNNLLQTLFSSVDNEQMSAYFSFINAHLCCAMTHIQDDIQSASLKIFDLMLKYFPKLVSRHSTQLLSNFVNLISKESGMGKSSTERVLSVNPSGRVQGQKWRSKVLQRLHMLLAALRPEYSVPKKRIAPEIPKGMSHQPLIMDDPTLNIDFKISNSQGFNRGNLQDILNEPGCLKKFVSTLMPILIQSWVECCPKEVSTAEIPMSDGLIDVMGSIVKVIQLLIQCISSSSFSADDRVMPWFCENFQKSLVTHLMDGFPFSESSASAQKAKEKENKVSAADLNLLIADIMSYLIENCKDNLLDDVKKAITDFIAKLQLSNTSSSDANRLLLKIIGSLLQALTPYKAEALIAGVCNMYTKSHVLSNERKLILAFIENKLLPKPTFHGSPVFMTLLSRLPKSLLEFQSHTSSSTSSFVLDQHFHVMRAVANQRHPVFTGSLKRVLTKIFGPAGCIFGNLQMSNQRQVVELMMTLESIQTETLRNVLLACRLPAVDVSIVQYIVQTLLLRFITKKKFCEPTVLLNFLFSLCLGHGCAEQNYGVSWNLPTLKDHLLPLGDVNNWERQRCIMQIAFEAFKPLPIPGQVWTVCVAFLRKSASVKRSLVTGLSTSLLILHEIEVHEELPKDLLPKIVNIGIGMAITAVALEMVGEGQGATGQHIEDAWLCISAMSSRVPRYLEVFLGELLQITNVAKPEEQQIIVTMLAKVLQAKFDTLSPSCLEKLKIFKGHAETIFCTTVDPKLLSALKYNIRTCQEIASVRLRPPVNLQNRELSRKKFVDDSPRVPMNIEDIQVHNAPRPSAMDLMEGATVTVQGQGQLTISHGQSQNEVEQGTNSEVEQMTTEEQESADVVEQLERNLQVDMNESPECVVENPQGEFQGQQVDMIESTECIVENPQGDFQGQQVEYQTVEGHQIEYEVREVQYEGVEGHEQVVYQGHDQFEGQIQVYETENGELMEISHAEMEVSDEVVEVVNLEGKRVLVDDNNSVELT